MGKVSIFITFGLCGLVGCGKGTAPVWSQANPSTEFGVNPVSHSFSFYSNDGRGLKAKHIEGKGASGNSFSADDIETTERSVENRAGNVEQMKAGTEMTKAAFDGATALIHEVSTMMPSFVQMVAAAHPPASSQPSLKDKIIDTVLEKAVH